MTDPLRRRVEEASLNAWPAIHQMLYDGWIVRFSAGYTKRANSVTVLYPSLEDIHKKVDRCEQLYRGEQLPPTFRLTPFAPPMLDPLLSERGYSRLDQTLVMQLALPHQGSHRTSITNATAQSLSLSAWMPHFCHLKEAALEQQHVHEAMLRKIQSVPLFATLEAQGTVVACGVAVLEGSYVGLFDLVTAREQRNQGYGTHLVQLLLNWAHREGAAHAYLQVVESNAPARHLYGKMGFRELYRYWYRTVPTTAAE